MHGLWKRSTDSARAGARMKKYSVGSYTRESYLRDKREKQIAKGLLVDKKRLDTQYSMFCALAQDGEFRASVWRGARSQCRNLFYSAR